MENSYSCEMAKETTKQDIDAMIVNQINDLTEMNDKKFKRIEELLLQQQAIRMLLTRMLLEGQKSNNELVESIKHAIEVLKE